MAIPHPADPESDSNVVARIRAGDERAFESLVLAHYNELCVFTARMTGSRATAEEIVQDVFLQLWRQRDRLAVSGSIVAYLYVAVRNRALNELHRERRWRRWIEQVTRERDEDAGRAGRLDADERVRSRDLEQAIERAIAALPPRCRQVYVLRRQEGLSYAEIAQLVGVTPKTVDVQIGKALRLLRRYLAEWL